MFECPICGERAYNVKTSRVHHRVTGETTMIKRILKCREHQWIRLHTVELTEDAYTELTTPKPGGEWVPVEKRPPDNPGYVFAIWKCKYNEKGYEIGTIKYLGMSKKRKPIWFNHKKVTHWLPMPDEMPDEWKEKE